MIELEIKAEKDSDGITKMTYSLKVERSSWEEGVAISKVAIGDDPVGENCLKKHFADNQRNGRK